MRVDCELIEFHDATIDRIELRASGEVRILFSHLAVYRRETPSVVGIWSFRAELRLTKTSSWNLVGQSADSNSSVDDIEVVDEVGASIPATKLLGDEVGVSAVHVSWSSGGKASFLRTKVSLALLESLERVESWDGG